MDNEPSPNRDNGRDDRGRFAKGNAGGPGNPFARRTAALRRLMLDTLTEDDLRAIVVKLIEMAKSGDLVAAKEVLTRCVGKPTEALDPDRNFDLEDKEQRQSEYMQEALLVNAF